MTTASRLLLVIIAAAVTGPWGQDRPDPAQVPACWETRLEALRPGDPLGYFELAEEIADEATTQPQRELARRLFGLAGALDPERIGRSACLALADLESSEHARRRLLALSALVDRRGGGADRCGPAGPARIDRGAALAVGEAMANYRKGDGGRALTALERPGAMTLLVRYGEVAFRGGATRFLEDCEHYRGSRRPMVARRDLASMLRLEAALLAGPDRSWSGDMLLTQGRPLVEVDADRIEETLGVDASKPCYRNGRWVACGE